MKDPVITLGNLVSEELIVALRGAFPALAVVPGMSNDEIMYESGQRRMIDYLAACYETANNED